MKFNATHGQHGNRKCHRPGRRRRRTGGAGARRGAAAKDALGRLTLKYQDRIYNALYRLVGDREDALDLAQETFLKAFQSLRRFKGESKFSTWLWTIALNLRTSKWRRRRTERKADGISVGAAPDDDGRAALDPPVADDPAQTIQSEEMNAAVQRAIQALPIDYRKVIVMRDIEGLDYEEISKMLKIPDGTVKSRLHRARMELKTRLEKYL